MDKGYSIKVPDKGYVRYVDHLGSDSRIVEAARVSYQSPSKGEAQDEKLLGYLWRNSHTSPFEQCSLTYNIKLPLFVQGQLVRHRTFRLNQQSARYTEMPEEFYLPDSWRKQDLNNKQGSIGVGERWNPKIEGRSNISASQALEFQCAQAHNVYRAMLSAGIAKEMARMILPQNLYTEVYINCDLHNLMHFFKLRLDNHAQWEIRQYALAMYEIFKELYPWSAKAFESQAQLPKI